MVLILGWFGTTLYLLAHAWLSFFKNTPNNYYYLANFAAAVSVAVSSYMLSSWQAFVINMFWAVVSFFAIKKYTLPRLPFSNIQLYSVLVVVLIMGAALWVGGQVYGLMLLGWGSTIAFCLGYWRFLAGRMPQRSYFLVNAYGAILILPQLYLDGNWPVLVLEIVWAAVSLWGWFKAKPACVLSP